MNERIRQLAEQATEYANEQNELHGVGYVITFKEKFAELIVKECVELVSATRDLAIEDGWNVDEAMSTAINDIEEHFGVEE
jgi:hypothetical protein